MVDGFVLTNATPEDIIEDWINKARKTIRIEVSDIIAMLERGENPYYQFTLSFDDCLKTIREVKKDYFNGPVETTEENKNQ